MEDTDFVKLGKFSYRGFETTSIRKLDKAAQAAKTGFEWDSGIAVISAKGIPIREHLSIAVEDETGWKKVEAFVERWMRSDKHDIKVKLTISYKKDKHIDEASSDEEDERSKKVDSFEIMLILGAECKGTTGLSHYKIAAYHTVWDHIAIVRYPTKIISHIRYHTSASKHK